MSKQCREDYKELDKIAGDLAILVVKLSRALHKVEPSNTLLKTARDFLNGNDFISEQDDMRYFFFAYTAQSPTRTADGNFWVESKTFPKNADVKAVAEARNPGMSVVVTNWQEFSSKEDYDAFRIESGQEVKISDIEDKAECYRLNEGVLHPYVMASREIEGDLFWSIISCITGDFFILDLGKQDLVKVLNVLEFTKE